jgi:hypothetical protein
MSAPRLEELVVAYNKVTVEARQVMALHHRLVMLLGAIAADGDRLQAAIAEAQRLEREICEAAKESTAS